MTPMGPAQQHAYDAGRFAELAETAAPGDWANPSPVAGWTALDVVRHLVDWLPGFVERAGVSLSPVDVDADPAGAWRQRSADVQRLVEQEGERPCPSPMFGEMALARAIDQFYTGDVWMHSWDLARALGLEPDLGEERCAAALEAMRPLDEVLRQSGQFGPQVPVSEDASAQDRFVGFIGRDPSWRR